MIRAKPASPARFITSLVVLGLVGSVLLFGRVTASHSDRYLFLIWNLILAGLAPLLAWWLVVRVRKYGWLHWKQIGLTIIWILFLPNSFYLISDMVHLRQTYEVSVLYDVVLLQSYVFAGLAFGYTSVYLVHNELQKRVRPRSAWLSVGGLFLISSFAIYLGRFTRWNTWDIVFRPAGILFDVSDRFINPSQHGDTYVTTLTFFVLLLATYFVIWEATRLIKEKN